MKILTGKTEERNIIHEKGIWNREVAVWIMNEILQKRASTKKQEPNKWAICAGHVDTGETVETAIIRELEEVKYFKVEELQDLYNEAFQWLENLKKVIE